MQLAVLGSYGSNGKIDINSLKQNLEAQGIDTSKIGDSLPVVVEVNGKTITITESGNAQEFGTATKSDGTAVTPGEIATETVTYTDANGDKAKIPRGFCIVKGSNLIGEGLVISDLENDDITNSKMTIDGETKQGNQFVWVPVTVTRDSDGTVTSTTFKQHTYVGSGTADNGTNLVDDTGWRTSYYRNYTDWSDETGVGNVDNVNSNGGFYIARYEAGFSTSISGGDTFITADTKNVDTGTPVSKKGAAAWNLISQTNAIKIAENMYPDTDTEHGVTSQLVDSYAWDTTSQWLQDSGYNVADSTSWGNYLNNTFTISSGIYAVHTYNSGWKLAINYEEVTSSAPYTKATSTMTEMATGIVETFKAKNIYDFAGNMFEWTTEIGDHTNDGTNEKTYGVIRGGGFSYAGSECPNTFRDGGCEPDFANISVGFRVILYIQ